MSIRHPSRRRGVLAIIFLVLVVLVMAAVLIRGAAGETPANPSPSPTSLVERPTLLVQLRDDSLRTVDNVVMGLHPTAAGEGAVAMYLPGDLVVDLREGLDETTGDLGVRPIADAGPLMSAQTGVRVDGAFVMDRLAFAGLVDAVGGVELDLSAPLVTKDGFGNITGIIPVGTRTLDGPQAAVYALYLGPDEPEIARQERFARVWQEVLAKLPENPERVRAILGNLGALARSTDVTVMLADYLTATGAAVRAGRIRSTNIATRPGALGPLPLQWTDPAPAAVQAAELFPGALVSDDPQAIRVRVFRGTVQIPQLETFNSQLRSSGFIPVWAGPGAPVTLSAVAAATPEDVAAAQRVATLSGADPAGVVIGAVDSPGAPVTVTYAAPPPATATATPSDAPTSDVPSS